MVPFLSAVLCNRIIATFVEARFPSVWLIDRDLYISLSKARAVDAMHFAYPFNQRTERLAR